MNDILGQMLFTLRDFYEVSDILQASGCAHFTPRGLPARCLTHHALRVTHYALRITLSPCPSVLTSTVSSSLAPGQSSSARRASLITPAPRPARRSRKRVTALCS